MELRERLTELILNANVTPYEIYIKTGVNESVLSRVRNGVTKKLNIRNSELLANFFGVSREWLMYEVGPKEVDKEKLFAIPGIQTAIPEKNSIDFMKLEWEGTRLVNDNEKLTQENIVLRETIKRLEVEIAVFRYKEDVRNKVKEDTMGEQPYSVQKTG